MCLLIAMAPGAIPDEDSLYQAALNNTDGFGWAMIVNDHIHVHRGMSAIKVIDAFMTMRRAHPEGAAIFHARWATHGVVAKENCQPFRVGGSPTAYMAHNGILPFQPDVGDRRSDTKLFADEILPGFLNVGALDSQRGLRAMEDMIGGDKIAILTVDPAFKHNLYILNPHKGHWGAKGAADQDIWYSNSSYQPPKVYTPKTYTSKGGEIVPFTSSLTPEEQADLDEWWARHEGCVLCGMAMNVDDDVCQHCDTCRWCESDAKDCECSHAGDLSDELSRFAKDYADEHAIDPDERDRMAMQELFANYD